MACYKLQCLTLACLALIAPTAFSFPTGAPSMSCKDPSTFHTKKINATHEGIIMPRDMSTNPYLLDVDAQTFTPGARITVTLHSGIKDVPFTGFFIQAVQANIGLANVMRRPFGTFENTTADEQSSECASSNGPARGGITHTNNTIKTSVTVTWIAPTTHNPGNVQFLATGVMKYDTYWTNIRSQVLRPQAYPQTASESTKKDWTATADWYRWLRRLRDMLHNHHGQNGSRDQSHPPASQSMAG